MSDFIKVFSIQHSQILKESGINVLVQKLEDGRSHSDINISRILGIAFIEAIADFCFHEEPIYQDALKKYAKLAQVFTIENNGLDKLLLCWHEIERMKNDEIVGNEFYGNYCGFSAATNWLAPYGVDIKECDESNYFSFASGAAKRVFECFMMAFIHYQPSARIAVKVAEAAIAKEEEWQNGTNLKFELVKNAVLDEVEKHIEALSKDGRILKEFHAFAQSIAERTFDY